MAAEGHRIYIFFNFTFSVFILSFHIFLFLDFNLEFTPANFLHKKVLPKILSFHKYTKNFSPHEAIFTRVNLYFYVNLNFTTVITHILVFTS
jgi:hypothetical protein